MPHTIQTMFVSQVALLVLIASLIGEAIALGPSFQPATSYPSSHFGTLARAVGDLNGDSLEDFAFAAPDATVNSLIGVGAVFLVWGKPGWFSSSLLTSSLTTLFPNTSLGVVITGVDTNNNQGFGNSVSRSCDLNNDAIDDLIVGSLTSSVYPRAAVAVIFGRRTADWPASLSFSQINGTNGFKLTPDNSWTSYFGYRVHCVGDFDGDKYNDLLLSDYYYSSWLGRVALVYGRASWPASLTISPSVVFGGVLFTATATPTYLGYGLNSIDLNVDGHQDLVIRGSGTDYVVWGGSGRGFVPTVAKAFTSTASLSMSSAVASTAYSCSFAAPQLSNLWNSITTDGDINGDNHNDLVYTPTSKTQNVYVVMASNTTKWGFSMSGSSIPNLITITSSISSSEMFGGAVAAGDINGDGVDDVIIGAYAAQSNLGRVYVVYGRKSLLLTASTTISINSTLDILKWGYFTGNATSGGFGTAVGVLHGPRNLIIVGAPNANSNRGLGYLLSGGPTCVSYTNSSSSGSCSKCVSGYALKNGACTACVAEMTYSDGTTDCQPTATATSCTSFSQAGTCLNCAAGTVLQSGQCLSCTGNTWNNGTMKTCESVVLPSFCNTINHATGLCSACQVGFGINSTLGKCTNCSNNMWSNGTTPCQTRSENCKVVNPTTNKCTTCNNGYFPKADGSCALCTNINNCTSCNPTSGDCLNCQTGFFPDSATTYCVPCSSISNCLTCLTNTSTCTKCSAGTGLKDDTCVNCGTGEFSLGSLPCQKCDSLCNSCVVETGVCTACYAGNGFDKATTKCSSCTDNTWSAGNTTCQPGPNNCSTANHTTGTCLTCKSGLELTNNGLTCSSCIGNTWNDDGMKCIAGPGNCSIAIHTSFGCETCLNGFKVDTTSWLCVSCSGNTFSDDGKTCKAGPTDCANINHVTGACSACSVGFGLDTATNNCTSCSGNTWSNGTTNCNNGSQHCININHETGACSQCTKGFGYYLSNNNCSECSVGSEWTDGTTVCKPCSDGAGKDNCLTCSVTDGKCSKCKAGTGLNSDQGTCITCKEETEWSDGTTVCNACTTGKGQTACLTCTTDNGLCTKCSAGNSLNTTAGTCTACTGDSWSNGTTTCKPCNEGPGGDNCETCDSTTSKCTKCQQHFGLNITAGTCTACKDGEISSGSGPCGKCYNVANECVTCTSTTCSACNPGFGLQSPIQCTNCSIARKWSDGTTPCKSCVDHCQKCKATDGKCTLCQSGWGLAANNGTCIQCSAVAQWSDGSTACKPCSEECMKCNSDDGKCSQCDPGFGVSGGECSECEGNQWSDGTTECKAGVADDNCTTADTKTGHCTTCKSGFGLDTTTGKCSECVGNTFNKKGTAACQPGPTDCKTINHTSGECVACKSGFGLNTATNNCTACSGNKWNNGTTECEAGPSWCVVADHSTGSCVTCEAGHGLVDGKCSACLGDSWSTGATACQTCLDGVGGSHCDSCNMTNGKCTKCAAGFGLNKVAGTCTSCTSSSSTTTMSSSSNMWSDGSSTCKACSAGVGGTTCFSCSITSGLCAQCSSSEFILANGTCTQQYKIVLNLPANTTTVNVTELAGEIAKVIGIDPSQVQVIIKPSEGGKVVLVVLLPDNTKVNVPVVLANQTSKWLRNVDSVTQLPLSAGATRGTDNGSNTSLIIGLAVGVGGLLIILILCALIIAIALLMNHKKCKISKDEHLFTQPNLVPLTPEVVAMEGFELVSI